MSLATKGQAGYSNQDSAARVANNEDLVSLPAEGTRTNAVDVAAEALSLSAVGLSIFPLAAGQKFPPPEGWQKIATTDADKVSAWLTVQALEGWPDAVPNYAVKTGRGILVVDIDNKNGKSGDASLETLEAERGTLPATLTVSTPTGGRHQYYRVPADRHVPNSTSKLGVGLDVRGDGGYVVGPGSTVEAGTYQRVNDAAIADAPEWLIEWATEKRAAKEFSSDAATPQPIERHGVTLADAESMLSHLDKDRHDYEPWSEMLFTLRRTGLGAQDGSDPSDWDTLADAWSRAGSKYSCAADVHNKMREADGKPGYGWRHLVEKARANGFEPSDEQAIRWSLIASTAAFSPVTVDPGEPPQPASVGDIPEAHHRCTDLANANRLRNANRGLLVVHAGAFYTFTGTHWSPNETIARRRGAQLSGLVREEVKGHEAKLKTLQARLTADLAEQYKALQQCARPERSKLQRDFASSDVGSEILALSATIAALRKWAFDCESESRINSALRLLKGMLSISTDQFDRHPHLLNCRNGTVDLRTGAIKPHDPNDFITRLAPVDYNPKARAPRFRQFVLEIMNGDQERADFIKREMGYSATGETSEQKWVLSVGEGANGKGLLYNTTQAILGSYAHTVPSTLLVVKGNENRHPTEIADLFGPRFVLASETEDGAHLREAFLKNITGEDTLSGRRMYQDHFTFKPVFKLHLQTNKKPVIKGQEHATWRRIILLEFKVKFGSASEVAEGDAHQVRDNDLAHKLLAESSGILNWIVEGAMEWYAKGLQPPESVIESAKQYKSEQDRVGEFVRTCCVLDPNTWSSYTGPFDGLYPAYVRWTKDANNQPLGKGRFIEELARVVPRFRKQDKKLTVNDVRRTFEGAYGLRLDLDGGGGEAVSSNEDLV